MPWYNVITHNPSYNLKIRVTKIIEFPYQLCCNELPPDLSPWSLLSLLMFIYNYCFIWCFHKSASSLKRFMETILTKTGSWYVYDLATELDNIFLNFNGETDELTKLLKINSCINQQLIARDWINWWGWLLFLWHCLKHC